MLVFKLYFLLIRNLYNFLFVGRSGWVESGGWTRLYYHRGESVRVRGGAEALLRRLASVAPAHAHSLHEMTLERGAASQLGMCVYVSNRARSLLEAPAAYVLSVRY